MRQASHIHGLVADPDARFREAGQDAQAAWVLLSAWSDLAPLYPTEWFPACHDTALASDASRL
jgi:hypothetical protein